VIYSKWTSSSRRDGLIYFCNTTERLLSSPSPLDDSHWSYRDVANRLVVEVSNEVIVSGPHPHRHNDSRCPRYLVEEYKRRSVALASPSNFWNFCFMNSFGLMTTNFTGSCRRSRLSSNLLSQQTSLFIFVSPAELLLQIAFSLSRLRKALHAELPPGSQERPKLILA